MSTTFDPMGLRQEHLKEFIYSNVKTSKNWVDRINKSLEIRYRQQFINRFIWTGLPNSIDSQQLERMLYYRGTVGLFYDKYNEDFVILPVTMQTNKNISAIDLMGRWNRAKPIPFNGGSEDIKKSQNISLELIGSKDIIKGVPIVNSYEEAIELIDDSCVLLNDYTPGNSENLLTRKNLDLPFLEGSIELLKMIRTASLNSTGVQWVKVNNEAEANIMRQQFDVYDNLILNGTRYICVMSTSDIQEGATVSTTQMQEFWASWQSLDNLHMSCIGIANDGKPQKTSYQNIQEQALDNVGTNPVLLDSWLCRIKFCTIANALFGLQINCEILETGIANNQEKSNSVNDQRESGEE
jgi:hypothetical protein